MVRIPQRKVTKCNTYNHSFFFIIVFLQFSIKFCFSGCLVLITNSKLVISVGKRRGFSKRLCELTREKFSMRQEQVNIIFIQSSKKVSSSRDIHSNENHSLLGNPLILPQIQILISFWSQKAEKQKFEIEEKVKIVASQKMPARHFYSLRHHIFFYIKFLVFCFLAPDGNQYLNLGWERGDCPEVCGFYLE